MKILVQILFVLFTQTIFAQARPGSLGYSPLPAKIVSENFKSSTKPKEKGKLSLPQFLKTVPSESLHIYSIYEMDSAGVFDREGNFVPVDSKFMDLYLVYEYKYRLRSGDVENFNKLVPPILSGKGDQLIKIRVKSYYSKKGKIKSQKIKKRHFEYSIKNGYLSINIDKAQLTNPYIEISILIKSRNFMQLKPVFTDGRFFSRYLECSLPSFLVYLYPTTSQGYELVSTSESYFKVLELDRESKDWDTVARKHSLTVNTKSWKLTKNTNLIKPIELAGIAPSFNIDMGFNLIDILK